MDPTTITAIAGAGVLVIGAVVAGVVKIINTVAELKSNITEAHDTIKEVKHEVANGYISSLEHTVFELRKEITLLRAEFVVLERIRAELALHLRGQSDEEGI